MSAGATGRREGEYASSQRPSITRPTEATGLAEPTHKQVNAQAANHCSLEDQVCGLDRHRLVTTWSQSSSDNPGPDGIGYARYTKKAQLTGHRTDLAT